MQRETLRSSECGGRRPAHSAAESVVKTRTPRRVAIVRRCGQPSASVSSEGSNRLKRSRDTCSSSEKRT